MNVRGLAYMSSSTCIRDISDGTSNTFAAGEICGGYALYPESEGAWAITTWGWYGRFGGSGYYAAATLNNFADNYCFHSVHEGGAFFLFCDGQVRFISENIDFTTYNALFTIRGNEIIDDEDY